MKKEPTVLAIKTGCLKCGDRKNLREAGIIIVETDEPEKVRFLKPCAEIDGDEMLVMALKSLNNTYSDSGKVKFADLITKAITERYKLDED